MKIWKNVKGYEGLYQVSHKGDVKSLDRVYDLGNRKCLYRGKMMQATDNGSGYLRIKLSKNNKSRRVMVHRIVADAFLLNPKKYRVVNHKDGNKKNNALENLEWCTHSYNNLHARKIGLIDVEKMRKINSETGKRNIVNIYGHNRIRLINTQSKKIYNSIQEAAKDCSFNRKKLSAMIRGDIENETSLIKL